MDLMVSAPSSPMSNFLSGPFGRQLSASPFPCSEVFLYSMT